MQDRRPGWWGPEPHPVRAIVPQYKELSRYDRLRKPACYQEHCSIRTAVYPLLVLRHVTPGNAIIASAMPDLGFDVTLRTAVIADAPALTAFARRTFEDAYRTVMAPDLMARVLRDQFSPERQAAEIAEPGAAWVMAEVDNTLAGYAYLRKGRVPEVAAPRDPVELARFYVDGLWHGRGVARVLMDAAVRRALQMGGRTLWLAVWQRNPRAMAFYRKYGFRTIGVCSWEHTPGALEDDLMLLELEAGPSA